MENKIEFKYPAFIAWLKQYTYPLVAPMAVITGSVDNCWEALIGQALMQACYNQWPMAFDIMEQCGFSSFEDKQVFMEAGRIIINNENWKYEQ